jgi:hypothetical protein
MAEGFLPFCKHLGVGGILPDLVSGLLGVDTDTYAVFAFDVIEGVLEPLAPVFRKSRRFMIDLL